jgi:hypothetical protein
MTIILPIASNWKNNFIMLFNSSDLQLKFSVNIVSPTVCLYPNVFIIQTLDQRQSINKIKKLPGSSNSVRSSKQAVVVVVSFY